MLYGKENREEADYLEPIFGAVCEGEEIQTKSTIC